MSHSFPVSVIKRAHPDCTTILAVLVKHCGTVVLTIVILQSHCFKIWFQLQYISTHPPWAVTQLSQLPNIFWTAVKKCNFQKLINVSEWKCYKYPIYTFWAAATTINVEYCWADNIKIYTYSHTLTAQWLSCSVYVILLV